MQIKENEHGGYCTNGQVYIETPSPGDVVSERTADLHVISTHTWAYTTPQTAYQWSNHGRNAKHCTEEALVNRSLLYRCDICDDYQGAGRYT